ncbi:MAG: integron integrase [Gemmatimonadota bacterium]
MADDPRLLDLCRRAMSARRLRQRTVRIYVVWIVRFVRFTGMRHPRDCDEGDVARFLAFLEVELKRSAATRLQALAALRLLYSEVIGRPLGAVSGANRIRCARSVPVVLDPGEIERVLSFLSGECRLMVELMYGAGLRLCECVGLRLRDVDVQRRRVMVRGRCRSGFRVTMLPESMVEVMAAHVHEARRRHFVDVMRGDGWVRMPTLEEGRLPGAVRSWQFSWLFPASRVVRDRETGRTFRRHVHPAKVQRAISGAVVRAGIDKSVSARAFRQSFAMHLLRSGVGLRAVQELVGHRDLSTTAIYLRAVGDTAGARSPLDLLRRY